MSPHAPTQALTLSSPLSHPFSHPSSPGEPTVLRCANTAEFLSVLPRLTGLTYEPGLFVVVFRGRRSQQAIRFDLPDVSDPSALRSFLTTVCTLLRRTGAASGHPALVLVTAEAFACDGVRVDAVDAVLESSFAPDWRDLVQALLRRFRREGWRLREFAVIAADAWSAQIGEMAGRRRELEEIELNSRFLNSALPDFTPRSLTELGTLPPADEARSELIASLITEFDARVGLTGLTSDSEEASPEFGAVPLWIHGAVRVAGACFDVAFAEQPTDPRLSVRLALLCEQPDGWFVCALTALTRPVFVIEMFEHGGASRLLGASPSVGGLLRTLAAERPNLGSLEQATTVLRELAAQLPLSRRAGVLSLLAWAWWHTGMQSLAQRFTDEALSIDPDHLMAQMVSRLNASAPQWQMQALRQPSYIPATFHRA